MNNSETVRYASLELGLTSVKRDRKLQQSPISKKIIQKPVFQKTFYIVESEPLYIFRWRILGWCNQSQFIKSEQQKCQLFSRTHGIWEQEGIEKKMNSTSD